LLNIELEGVIAVLTLDDPERDVNTVSPAWIARMTEAFERIRDDAAVSGVIITSAKPGFMAGADLNHILDHASRLTPKEAFEFSQRATAMHRLIERCGKPVVAALNGVALGGGYELALACHHRIVADLPAARVGLPEVTVGLLPGSGGTQRLLRLIGVKAAIDVLLEGRSYAPADAQKLGLVDAVVPADALMSAARDWLSGKPDAIQPWDRKGFALPESDGLLKQSTAAMFTAATARLLARYGHNYPAPISILTCVFEGMQVPFDTGLRIESRYFARLLTGPVSRNIIRTEFVNKGLAQKGARRPAEAPRTRVDKVGILGAGMMGAGIAFVSAQAGIDVILLDTSPETAAKGKAWAERKLGRAAAGEKTRTAQAAATLARIRPTAEYRDLAEVDLVIEAVFEDTAVKADVTSRAAHAIGEEAIFASNTSTLPISRLADAFARPEDFIGLHFFSPVDRMPLVEVIKGQRTSDATLARALDFVAQIGKIPIVVNDSRGFYTSRVFQTFIHEGLELLREGTAPALIENAARLAGMPVGPLAVLDEVSLDLPMKIVRQSEAEDPAYQRPGSMEVLETMAEEIGRHGRKTGGGFYEYPPDGAKRLWSDISRHFPPMDAQPDVEEVEKRLLYVQAIESVRCLEEGVLADPADADLGAVLGWGFPAWTGGTVSLIDSIGPAIFVSECDQLAARFGPRFAPTAALREMAAAGRSFAL
jgi:3-hydroxyacyl-CoA dehydrogenase/enoyl-CoA hydratase/3-hydroxybutyryl-CoA epimerase